ncbi:MAG: hypothetical protein Q8N99_05965 [Nanoarchaeota archaeon]|nr:hypothetical protein [Nanoarchaeota archaeon]
MKKKLLNILCFFCLIFAVNSVIASGDVAYIYKSKVDYNIINYFNDINLKTDLIKENNVPNDLSSYKLVYVGDENILKDINIEKYPSVITNYYIGRRIGLTDDDGISLLGSLKPLKVKVNNKEILVYTAVKDKRGYVLPYYFLDDSNKAKVLKKYAGTLSTSSGYDFGDVISYGKEGDVLDNGRALEQPLCFFGIVKSDYWTDDAKKLFGECVKYVYDYSVPINDTNESICKINSDCGESKIIGNSVCINNSVYKNILSYNCNNPNTLSSFCTNKTKLQLSEECSDYCENGYCNYFECEKIDDCNDNNPNTEDTCINPSTKQSSCSFISISCFDSSLCNDNNPNTEDTCISPGTGDSECKHEIIKCLNDLACNDNNPNTEDTCITPGTSLSTCTHTTLLITIACYNNSGCNDNNPNTEDKCISPGTGDSECKHETIIDYNLSLINVVHISASATTNSVTLSFSTEPDNSSLIKNFEVSKGNVFWDVLGPNISSYTYSELTPSTDYIFFARVVDINDVYSDAFNLSARTLDLAVNPPSGGSGGGGGAGGIGGSVCTTKWACGEWGECINGKQTRNCSYPINFCEPIGDKPKNIQECIPKVTIVSDTASYDAAYNISDKKTNEYEFTDSQEPNLNEDKKNTFPITGAAILDATLKYPWIGLIILAIIAGIYLYYKNKGKPRIKKHR